MAPNLACTVWFAKDAQGSQHLSELIYPVTALTNGSVWMFVQVKNSGPSTAKSFDADGRISNATYTVPQGEASKNITWLKNVTGGLLQWKKAATFTDLAKDATSKPWSPSGKLVFLSQQEVASSWVAGTGFAAKPHQVFIKMTGEAHVTYSGTSKACSTPQLALRYDDLP